MDKYIDFYGATAFDNVNGDITGDIRITSDVNINIVGQYTVTYTVTDSSGNTVSDYRIVNVTPPPDTTPPVLILNGNNPLDIIINEEYNELGATATDNIDGDISSQVKISGDTVDTTTLGTYVIIYTATDSSNNRGAFTQPTFQGDPKAYITQVGLYDDSRELLAIAKLSQPVLKTFAREAVIKVKLDF